MKSVPIVWALVGLAAGAALGIAFRPALPFVGQPPVGEAFTWMSGGQGLSAIATDYANSFRLTLFVFALIGGVIGALGAFGVAAYTRTTTRETSSQDIRWSALVEVDRDIAAAAMEARNLGHGYESQLAQKYMALGDKSYLPQIMEKLREAASAAPVNHKLFGLVTGNIEYEQLASGTVRITKGTSVGKVFANVESLKRFAGAE